jgi:hypothetical protein
MPIALSGFGCRSIAVCSNLAPLIACGLGFCDVDHVPGTFGDCWRAGGVDDDGWSEGSGADG